MCDRTTKRLESDASLSKKTRPFSKTLPKVAVVGAGISGLTCARTLTDHGFEVTVFEKSRGTYGHWTHRRWAAV